VVTGANEAPSLRCRVLLVPGEPATREPAPRSSLSARSLAAMAPPVRPARPLVSALQRLRVEPPRRGERCPVCGGSGLIVPRGN
jgi:hypothetical protein